MHKPTKFSNYNSLLKAVRKEIEEGQRIIERQQAITYWNVGRYIDQYVLHNKGRAGYGEKVYQKLSKDLSISVNTLERTVRFSQEFSISAARQKLSWTHYKTLMAVKDPGKRKQLEQKVIRENLNTLQLQQEINKYKASKIPAPSVINIKGKPLNSVLKCTRGKLYTYKVVKPPAHLNFGHELMVDCGFNVFCPVGKAKFVVKDGQIVESVKGKVSDSYRIVQPAGRGISEKLYTYKAHLERVIDGDTLWVMLDIGFGIYSRQKLRLNAINTPKLSMTEGLRAKRFVEKALKPLDFFIIKNHKKKVGKYARYLADIFYLQGKKDPKVVAKDGLFLNQLLLDKGLASVYQK